MLQDNINLDSFIPGWPKKNFITEKLNKLIEDWNIIRKHKGISLTISILSVLILRAIRMNNVLFLGSIFNITLGKKLKLQQSYDNIKKINS